MSSYDHPPTVPLVVPPVVPPAPAYADLPEAPAAYHREETTKKSSKRSRRPLTEHEQLGAGVLVTLVVLIVAKALADANDVGSNVVDVLLYAVLATIVGVVVVGVGGGLVTPMRSRWQRLLGDTPGADDRAVDTRLL